MASHLTGIDGARGDEAGLQDVPISDPPFVDCKLRPFDTQFAVQERRNSDDMHTPSDSPPVLQDAGEAAGETCASSSSVPEEYKAYFSTRSGALVTAFEHCKQLLLPSDGSFDSVWLLTLIDHWDVEKERVVLLTSHTMHIVKYDFIRLRVQHVQQVSLSTPDRITSGNITYPPLSLTPRITGIAGGVVSVVRGCMMGRFSATMNELRQRCMSSRTENSAATCGGSGESAVSSERGQISFQPRYRHIYGVQIRWDGGKSVSPAITWNPLARHVPFVTFTSHPLCNCQHGLTEVERNRFSVESFSGVLSRLVTIEQRRQQQILQQQAENAVTATRCVHVHDDIVVENYVGVLSALHNSTALGFFKERGNISF